VYAGCVYWPLHDHTTIGAVLASLVLVGGLVDATVKTVKEARKLSSGEAKST